MAEPAAGSSHRWKFFKAGGVEQVALESGADLAHLGELDQKLWFALSCPVGGLEFDTRTLELIDTNKDGRIRAPELIAATSWACALLKDPDDLIRAVPQLPLGAINNSTPEGREVLGSARQVLINLGKEGSGVVTLEDVADPHKIFAGTRFNGDGLITALSASDDGTRAVIADVLACLGGDTDRCGDPGLSEARIEEFFSQARALVDWSARAHSDAATLMPLGEGTAAAVAALKGVRAKVDDYFARCDLASFDARAAGPLNRSEADFQALATRELTQGSSEIAHFPLAKVEPGRALPLGEGINPAWASAVQSLKTAALEPLLGELTSLTASQWRGVCERLSPHEVWAAAHPATRVEKLGLPRLEEILAGGYKEKLLALIAQDKEMADEAGAIEKVEKLVRLKANLFRLLNNFVSFRHFYTREKAIFQAGVLFLDSKSCELCVRVDDMGKHGSMAPASMTFLVYCDCERKATGQKMTIAAAVTQGDAELIKVGRNGLFYDRKGDDWDATVVKVVEQPISIRTAFWAPYHKIAGFIDDQIEGFASSREKAVTDQAAARVADSGTAVTAGERPASQPSAFDVGKFAGIFAAVGLALGTIGSALAAVASGFFGLSWWQMPLALAGVALLISGPSMLLAWLKLRQRTLGPLLDAGGWAINAHAVVNIPLGAVLTHEAELPEGAESSHVDPYEEKRAPWRFYTFLALLIFVAVGLWKVGLLPRWLGLEAEPAAAPAAAEPAPAAAPAPAPAP